MVLFAGNHAHLQILHAKRKWPSIKFDKKKDTEEEQGESRPAACSFLKKAEFLEKDGRTDIVFQAKEEEEEEEVPRIDKSWRQSRSGRKKKKESCKKSLPPRQLLRIFSPSSNSSGCPRIRFSNNKKVIRRRLEKQGGEPPDEHMQKKRRKRGGLLFFLFLPALPYGKMRKWEEDKKIPSTCMKEGRKEQNWENVMKEREGHLRKRGALIFYGPYAAAAQRC